MSYPEDFAEKYHSVWVDIPSHLFDPARAHAMYNDTLDELELAATIGYDGVCVNEHHQNGYGIMPSPNIMAASLARRTRDVAHHRPRQLASRCTTRRCGSPKSSPCWTCISGGRLIAGFPVGSSQDTNFAYGDEPGHACATATTRPSDLIVEAWTNPDVFAFDGKYTQLRYVNIWPRPIQQPHPPDLDSRRRLHRDLGLVPREELPVRLPLLLRLQARQAGDGRLLEARPTSWASSRTRTTPDSSSSSPSASPRARSRSSSARTASTSTTRCCTSTRASATRPATAPSTRSKWDCSDRPPASASGRPYLTWKDLVANGNIVAGTPSQVAEQLEHVIKSLRIGHLMVLNQFGSIPHDLAMDNIS